MQVREFASSLSLKSWHDCVGVPPGQFPNMTYQSGEQSQPANEHQGTEQGRMVKGLNNSINPASVMRTPNPAQGAPGFTNPTQAGPTYTNFSQAGPSYSNPIQAARRYPHNKVASTSQNPQPVQLRESKFLHALELNLSSQNMQKLFNSHFQNPYS